MILNVSWFHPCWARANVTCVCFISFSRTWAREALKSEKTSPGAVCSVPGFTSMIKSCVQRAKVHFFHRASGSYQDRLYFCIGFTRFSRLRTSRMFVWPRFSNEKRSQTEVLEGSRRRNHVIYKGFLTTSAQNQPYDRRCKKRRQEEARQGERGQDVTGQEGTREEKTRGDARTGDKTREDKR